MRTRPGSYLPLPESQTIGIHRSFLACTTSDIIEASHAKEFPRLFLQLVWIGGHGRQLLIQQTIFIYFLSMFESARVLFQQKWSHRLECAILATTFRVIRVFLDARHGTMNLQNCCRVAYLISRLWIIDGRCQHHGLPLRKWKAIFCNFVTR